MAELSDRRPHYTWENRSLAVPEFDIGEIVRLKSGGPAMTVQSALQGGLIITAWFAGDALQGGNFEPASLERVL